MQDDLPLTYSVIIATDPHIPEMLTGEGLLDIVALGNLCLFLSALENFAALNYPKANSALPKARRAYLDLIYQLRENYSLVLLSDEESTYSYEELFHHALVSHDIAEFAKSSAVYFACSLIVSARKSAGWRQLDIIHFEQSVKRCLDFFFSSDLDDDLLNASIDRHDRLFHLNHQILVWPKSSPLGKWFSQKYSLFLFLLIQMSKLSPNGQKMLSRNHNRLWKVSSKTDLFLASTCVSRNRVL